MIENEIVNMVGFVAGVAAAMCISMGLREYWKQHRYMFEDTLKPFEQPDFTMPGINALVQPVVPIPMPTRPGTHACSYCGLRHARRVGRCDGCAAPL